MSTNNLPEGFKEHPTRPGVIMSLGDPFPTPTLPDWENLPDDLIAAMGMAHADASYAYGDEGYGYNPHLMLAYLLQSDAFKAWQGEPIIDRRITYQYGVNSPQRYSVLGGEYDSMQRHMEHVTQGPVDVIKREYRPVYYGEWVVDTEK